MTVKSSRITSVGITIIMVATSLIYMYTAGFGIFSAITQRALLLTLLGPPVFLLYELKIKGKTSRITKMLDIGMAIAFMHGIYHRAVAPFVKLEKTDEDYL